MRIAKLLSVLLLPLSLIMIFTSCGSSFYDALDQFYAELSIDKISTDESITSYNDTLTLPEPELSTKIEITEKKAEGGEDSELLPFPETTIENDNTTAVVSETSETANTISTVLQTETTAPPDETTVVSITEESTVIVTEEITEEVTTSLLTEEVTTAKSFPETTAIVDAVKEYQNWIGTQFNSLDGSHKTLSEMIRAYVKLTGGSSYKHIKTEYQVITDTATLNAYKSELKKAGFNPNQVSLYDLVVMTSVSYKNEYGVKQSQSAAAIAHYSSDSLTWLNIGLEWSLVH